MIYLDCSYIFRDPAARAGLQRVTRCIAQEAAKLRGDVRWAALTESGAFVTLSAIPQPTDQPWAHQEKIIAFEPGDVYFVLDSLWDRKVLERLSPFVPFGLICGVMYHDLIPITHERLSGISRNVFTDWVEETLRYADFFACNSQETARSLKAEALRLHPSRTLDDATVFSFPLGADLPTMDPTHRPTDKELLYAFEGGNTWLIVSTLEPRKNHACLLDAFDRLWTRYPHLKLCFIGRKGWMIDDLIERVENHPLGGKSLFWFRNVPDRDLQWAYQHAKGFLFPSWEEGFGLPILESLHYGTPVLASDIPVFHEIAGDRIGYFDPARPDSLAEWILRIEVEGLPERLRPDGSFRWPTWKESAQELLLKIDAAVQIARQTRAVQLKHWRFERRVALELERELDAARPAAAVVTPAPLHEECPAAEPSLPPAPAALPAPLPIRRLLQMNGHELIRHAYVRLLHRLPDPDGEAAYLEKLMAGFPPLSLLSALRFSEEGQAVGEPVRHPLALRLLGRLLGTSRLPGKLARYLAALRFLPGTRGMARAATIQLQETNAALEILRGQYHASMEAWQDERHSLRAAFDAAKQALEERSNVLQGHIDKALEQNKALEAHANTLQGHIDTALEQNRALEARANILQGHIDTALEQNRALEERSNILQGRIDTALEQNKALEARANILQGRIDTAPEQNRALEERSNILQGRIDEAQEQNKALEVCSNILQGRIDEALEQNKALEARANILQGHIDTAQEQNKALEARSNALEEGVAGLKMPPSLPFSHLTEAESFLARACRRIGSPPPATPEEREAKFYTYFSEIWGEGYEENLRSHYESYLPHLPLKGAQPFLDFGCGAGEFLAFMQGHGMKTLGVEVNPEEARRCKGRGLRVHCADGLDFLERYSGAFSGISLLQVIEHIPMDRHIKLLQLAHRKLHDGGLLILETINPGHPLSQNGFFTDPTHLRPIPSDYLAFLAQWSGFRDVRILFLYPTPLFKDPADNPRSYYYNYAILARKGKGGPR